MAIFGSFSTVRAQMAQDARFTAAFAYIAEVLQVGSGARHRVEALAIGASAKIELAGGAFAIEAAYHTKPRPEGFFESHRQYIDVQVIVAGRELMEVEDISRLVVSEAFLAERDLIKYADTGATSLLKLLAGDAAIFFPVDGHMPSLQLGPRDLVRKTVVKVPVS